ncbi:class I mannose-6-phosphate isomerase [Rubrobacter marinus]|uniref:class I mannose-6-phosphate isomerase n=1 Tax=Rubrobacter marinus TaxID=2653852 RepID=UPI001A9DB099|nr:class I mannose-6-phosphate isomerase [Rubrobacter marinus]
MEPYPIKLTPHVRTYYFGERLIPEMLGKEGMPDGRVAESWEVSDYREARETVANGPYAGRPFHELVEEFPDEMVGQGWQGPHFPLLLKFLDASHMLPVHLHADDETAREKHGEPHGKSEAWHVLWAAPGASILAGVKDGLSREDLFRAFKDEDFDGVMPRHEVRTGETVYVPGGIIHSFGPGILIAEIQQTSDLGQFVTPTDLYGERLDEETWNANINAALDELKTDYAPGRTPASWSRTGPTTASYAAPARTSPSSAGPWPSRTPSPRTPPLPPALERRGGRGDARVCERLRGARASRVLRAARGAREVRVVPDGAGRRASWPATSRISNGTWSRRCARRGTRTRR